MSSQIKSADIFNIFEKKLWAWRKEQSDELKHNKTRLERYKKGAGDYEYKWIQDLPDNNTLINMLTESNEEAKNQGSDYFTDINELLELSQIGDFEDKPSNINEYYKNNLNTFQGLLEGSIKESGIANSIANVYIKDWDKLKEGVGFSVMDQYPPGDTGMYKKYSPQQRFKTSGHIGPGAFFGPTADMIYGSDSGSPNYLMTQEEAEIYHSPEEKAKRVEGIKDFYTTAPFLLGGGSAAAARPFAARFGSYLGKKLPSLSLARLLGMGKSGAKKATDLASRYAYTPTVKTLNTFVSPVASKTGTWLSGRGPTLSGLLTGSSRFSLPGSNIASRFGTGIINRLGTVPFGYGLYRGMQGTSDSEDMYGPTFDFGRGAFGGLQDYYTLPEYPGYQLGTRPATYLAKDIAPRAYSDYILPILQAGGDEDAIKLYNEEVRKTVDKRLKNIKVSDYKKDKTKSKKDTINLPIDALWEKVEKDLLKEKKDNKNKITTKQDSTKIDTTTITLPKINLDLKNL